MKKILLLLCVLALMGGCSKYRLAISALNQVNEQCADSIIYRTIPAPDITSGIIQISLNQFVKANEGYRSWAISVNQLAIRLADDPAMTPAKFATEIIAETMKVNEWWGAELVRLVEPVFDMFKLTNTSMSQCDREFIKRFCQAQLSWWQELKLSFLHGSQPAAIPGLITICALDGGSGCHTYGLRF